MVIMQNVHNITMIMLLPWFLNHAFINQFSDIQGTAFYYAFLFCVVDPIHYFMSDGDWSWTSKVCTTMVVDTGEYLTNE